MAIQWLSRRWTLLILLVFLIAALVFMPLRFALASAVPEPSVVSAKSVQGTIWSGSITDLKAGPVSFGNMRTELSFFPLLTGRAVYQLSKANAQDSQGITGTIGNGWGGVQAHEITGTANYQTANAMIPVSGIEFQNFSVRFAGGSCRMASGSVRLTMRMDAIRE
jgi:general secretion pathway protein N